MCAGGRATAGPLPPGSREYVPRDAAASPLYAAVAGAFETFLAAARARDRNVPAFVERELRDYLQCGIAAHGFLRVHCPRCGLDRVVPYSCKGRGFCPSCCARRMADTAAHLVERVLPRVPLRQWVLTVPVGLRYRMAFDAALTGAVLRAFLRALFAELRRSARATRPIAHPQCGAVTFIQRFGDALNLNVHFHVLALDGVFDMDEPDGPWFLIAEPPEDEEILRVLQGFARRLEGVLRSQGAGEDAEDPLPVEQPLLAEIYGAAATGRVACGPRRGKRLRRLGDRIAIESIEETDVPGCVSAGGFSVHAAVAVPANDRQRLERLCRYAARPPLALGRLDWRDDGSLVYRLRHRWRDGTTHVVLSPIELVERLAMLVPPPRAHIVRYHGILAPAARWRDHVVPAPPAPSDDGVEETPPPREGRRFPWADLLARVFAVDALRCPRCAHAMRIVAAIHSPEAVRAILECLGQPARPPPLTPGRLDRDDNDSD